MQKDSFWFRHDSNARNDVKMIRLARIAGMEGVGAFWCIVEILREEESHKISKENIEDIAYTLRIDISVIEKIVESKLLTFDGESYYSESLLNRMLAYNEIKEKRKKAGSKGGKAKAKASSSPSKIIANAKQKDSKTIANRIELNRVEKNREEKNIKKKPAKHKHGEFQKVLLLDSELEKLKKEFGELLPLMIKNLDEAIEQYGYSYKNHNLVLRKWQREKPISISGGNGERFQKENYQKDFVEHFELGE